jgi:hypothetical protein
MWKLAFGAVVLLALAGCKPAAGNAPAANAAAAPIATNAPPANVASAAAPTPAAPAAPSFQITVTLSPGAASQLQSLGQDVIISADFYGQANAQGAKLADDEGEIALANEVKVTLPAAGMTTVQVPPLNQSLYPDIQGGEAQMLINVFSGEGLNPDNKLDCGLFQDRLALAEQSGIQIACKLIGEN